MSKLPKRNDNIYKEIENFNKYEYINCITFEMAIRNKEVLKYLDYSLIKFDEYENTEIIPFRAFNEGDEKRKEHTVKVNNYLYEKNIYKLEEEYCIDFNSVKLYLNLINNKIDSEEKISAISMSDSLTVLEVLKKESYPFDDKINQKIFNKFSRPSMKVPEQLKKSLPYINLNLPKDELVAYISKIKEEYDKDNSIIKTPLELMGENLEKAVNEHTQKKPNTEKYADWFYIYDCYKILKTNDIKKSNDTIYGEIDLLLLDYYNSTKENYYSLETYKKTIMKNMKYLIDNLGYKELITGAKNN